MSDRRKPSARRTMIRQQHNMITSSSNAALLRHAMAHAQGRSAALAIPSATTMDSMHERSPVKTVAFWFNSSSASSWLPDCSKGTMKIITQGLCNACSLGLDRSKRRSHHAAFRLLLPASRQHPHRPGGSQPSARAPPPPPLSRPYKVDKFHPQQACQHARPYTLLHETNARGPPRHGGQGRRNEREHRDDATRVHFSEHFIGSTLRSAVAGAQTFSQHPHSRMID